MTEAQDTWSPNILIRMQLYRHEILKRDIEANELMLLSSKMAVMMRI